MINLKKNLSKSLRLPMDDIMKLLLIFFITASPIFTLADEQRVKEIYKKCLTKEFYTQYASINQCDFHSLLDNPPKMKSIQRTCKMALVKENMGNPQLNELVKQIDEQDALDNLNKLLNNKLEECNQRGEIELLPDGSNISLQELNTPNNHSPFRNKGSK